MSTPNPFNPNVGSSSLVDQVIGNKSYHVVRTVYDSLEVLTLLALNITSVQQAANNAHRHIAEIQGNTGILGSVSAISLPQEITMVSIIDFNVLILGNDDALYSSTEGHFTSKIEDGFLKVTLAGDAPSTLANASIRAAITYKG